MPTNLKDVLSLAYGRGYAVPAFNMESVMGDMQTAQEPDAPVIIMMCHRLFDNPHAGLIAQMIHKAALQNISGVTMKTGLNSLCKHSEHGILDYSIFLDEKSLTLFAFRKITDGGTPDGMREEALVREWRDYSSYLMECLPDHEPVSVPLDEVFHME